MKLFPESALVELEYIKVKSPVALHYPTAYAIIHQLLPGIFRSFPV